MEALKATSRDILDRENRYGVPLVVHSCAHPSFERKRNCFVAHMVFPPNKINCIKVDPLYIIQSTHCRVLREAKTSIEHEANQLRLRNDSLSQQVSQLQQELHALQHEKGSTISELRAELKMKAFELTTLGVSFEVFWFFFFCFCLPMLVCIGLPSVQSLSNLFC